MPVTWMPKVDWLSEEGRLREQLDAEWAKIQAELRSRRTLPSRPTALRAAEGLPFEVTPSAPAWASARLPTPAPAIPSFLSVPQLQEEPLQLLEPIPTRPRRQRQTILEQPPIVPSVEVEAPKEKKEPVSFWRRALQIFAKPFEFVQENIIKPAEALVGTGLGIAPEVERLPGEDFWAWKKRSWAGWETPGINLNLPILGKVKLDVKFVLETAPWLLIPGAGQVGTATKAGRGIAGKFGKLGGVGRGVGTVIEYSPWGLAEKGMVAAVRGVTRTTTKVSTAVGEKLFGKYVPPPIAPVVIKLNKYMAETVRPAYKEFRKAVPDLRARQEAGLREAQAAFRRGEIKSATPEVTRNVLQHKFDVGIESVFEAVDESGKTFAKISLIVSKPDNKFLVETLGTVEAGKLTRGKLNKILDSLVILAREQNVRYISIDFLPEHLSLYKKFGFTTVSKTKVQLDLETIPQAKAVAPATQRGEITGEELTRLEEIARAGGIKERFNLNPKALAARQAKDISDVESRIANGEISEATGKALITGIKKDPAYAIITWTREEGEELSRIILEASEYGQMNANSRSALLEMLMGEAKTLPSKHIMRDWGKVFGEDFAKTVASIIGNKEMYGGGFIDTLNIARSLQSSIDLSATLRQGLILSLLHPTQAPVWFGKQVKALMSEKMALEIDDAMRADPLFKRLRDLDLFAAELRGATMATAEELFPSRLARIIPGIRRSERAFVTYTNQARFHAGKDAYNAMTAQGATEKELRLAMRFINLSSGRGEIPKSLEAFSPALNALLFSPRLQASTLQLPRQIGRMLLSKNPYMRKEAAKAFVTFVGGGASILGLINMYGGKVELDPRSGDFAKIKIGDTRLDIWRGYVQYARFAGTMLTGERKSAFGNLSQAARSETAWRFLQSKGSPAFGMMVDLLRNETYEGKPIFNDTTGFVEAVKGRILPLALQDIMDAMEQGGINQAWVAAPAGLGIGALTFVNDYVKVKTKIAKGLGYKSWDDIDPKTQREIENRSGELQAATIAFDRQIMGTAFGDWRLAGNAVEDVFRLNVERAVAKFQTDGDGYAFRNKVKDAFTARRGGYAAREKEPRFADIVSRRQTQDTLESLVGLGYEETAIKAYDDALYGEDMYDEFGDYRFEEADIRKEQLRNAMGEELFKYVEDYHNIKYETYPLEFQELIQAKRVMKPYWDVRGDVSRIFGEAFTETLRGKRLIAKLRKRVRRNPEIERYFQMFYARNE